MSKAGVGSLKKEQEPGNAEFEPSSAECVRLEAWDHSPLTLNPHWGGISGEVVPSQPLPEKNSILDLK